MELPEEVLGANREYKSVGSTPCDLASLGGAYGVYLMKINGSYPSLIVYDNSGIVPLFSIEMEKRISISGTTLSNKAGYPNSFTISVSRLY